MRIDDENKKVIIELTDTCVMDCISLITDDKEDYDVLVENEEGRCMPITAYDHMRGYEVRSGYPFAELTVEQKRVIMGMCFALDNIQSVIDEYNIELGTAFTPTMRKIELDCGISALEETIEKMWIDISEMITSYLDGNEDDDEDY